VLRRGAERAAAIALPVLREVQDISGSVAAVGGKLRRAFPHARRL
jgi:hypothetical protein